MLGKERKLPVTRTSRGIIYCLEHPDEFGSKGLTSEQQAGISWFEEHEEELFASDSSIPKELIFYGTDEEFEKFKKRLKEIAEGTPSD